jgi:hypothetical protein
VAADGVGNIVISPVLSDSVRVAGVTMHENLHHAVGMEHGHRRPFADACVAVGLTLPATATGESDDFRDYVRWTVVPQIGEYPHAPVDFTRPMPRKDADPDAPAGDDPGEDGPVFYPDGRRKQTTRMVKVTCPSTPKCSEMPVRLSRKWIDAGMAPLCPCCSKPMGEDA